jgi:anti-sigma B factor antagonist
MGTRAPGFDVQQKWIDRVVVLSVRGDVDALTAPRLTEEIHAVLADEPSAVIVDLSAVDFLASSGMTVLVSAKERITPGAGFGVVADGPGVARSLRLMGIDGVIALHSTLDAALSASAKA